MAALWSCAIAVVLGLLLTRLAGRRAGIAAALLSGLLSSAPVIEGFTANGELMATLPALVALALTARWHARGGLRIMFARRPLRGRGLPRQAVGLRRRARGRDSGSCSRPGAAGGRPAEALRALAALAGGVALIIGLAVLHGALTGLDDWWFAIADYRLSVESVATGSLSERWSLFTDSLRTAGPVVGALTVVALPGVWLARAPARDRPARALARPLADRLRARRPLPRPLLRGAAHAALRARRAGARRACPSGPRWRVGLAVLVLPVYKAWPAYTADGTRERSLASSSDSRIVSDGAVGRYLNARTAPDDRIYALYANAGLYLAAERRSPYPYLWFLGIQHIPGALQLLRDTLAGPDAPRYIAVYQQPRTIDKSDRADSHRPHPHAPVRPRRDRRGRPDLAPEAVEPVRRAHLGPGPRWAPTASSCRARGGRARARRTGSWSAGRPRRGRCAGCARLPCSAARSR